MSMNSQRLYQGNIVKVIKGNMKWLNQIGHVVDENDTKYIHYPVKVYFPKYEISEYFGRDQLEKS